jgi:hypothetical protein
MNNRNSNNQRDDRRDDDEPTWPEPTTLNSGQAWQTWADGPPPPGNWVLGRA